MMLSSVSLATEDTWFVGDWISDAETTITKNPKYRDVSSEVEERLWDLYGKLRWKVTSQTLQVIHLAKSEAVNYTFEETPDGTFTLGVPDQEITLIRTERGFCMLFAFHDAVLEPESLECFIRWQEPS